MPDEARGVLPWFGVPFGIAGALILWFLVLAPLAEWWAMRGWEPASARVLEASLLTEEGGARRAVARYRYRHREVEHEGDRIALLGGSDGIGAFQEEMAATLGAAAQRGEPITVYVNPQAPEEAVVHRELRLLQWALLAVAGTAFSGFGLFLVALGRSAPPRVLGWLFTGIFGVLSAGATMVGYEEVFATGNAKAALLFAFPVGALFLLRWAWRGTAEARRGRERASP